MLPVGGWFAGGCLANVERGYWGSVQQPMVGFLKKLSLAFRLGAPESHQRCFIVSLPLEVWSGR